MAVGGKEECLCPSPEVTLCLRVMLWKRLDLSLTWLLHVLHSDGSTCLIGYRVPSKVLSPTIQEPAKQCLDFVGLMSRWDCVIPSTEMYPLTTLERVSGRVCWGQVGQDSMGKCGQQGAI